MRLLIILFFCFGFLINSTFSNNQLQAYQKAPLYTHLYEINKYWLKLAPSKEYLIKIQFTSDRERIQKHLELVEGFCVASP